MDIAFSRIRRFGGFLFLLVVAVSASADNFTLPTTGGNWSNIGTWYQNGLPATRTPGSLVGTPDTVSLAAPMYTVSVDLSVAEPVTLTMASCGTGPCVLDVQSGGVLRIGSASSVGDFAVVSMSGGTIQNASTLDFAPKANFDWAGGVLNGGGITNLTTGITTGARIDVTSGVNTIGSQTVNVNDWAIVDYVGGSLSIDDGAQLNVNNGGQFLISSLNGIATNGVGGPGINNVGLFQKNGGAFGTNITVSLLNNAGGTIEATIGTLVLGGSPVHNGGTFSANGGDIELAGIHSMSSALSWSGANTFKVTGDVTIESGALVTADHVVLAGGAINGPGAIDVNTTLTLDGGNLQTGLVITVNSTATMTHTAVAAVSLYGINFVNDGAIVFNAGTGVFSINSGTLFTNNPGKTITLNGDVTIGSDLTGGARIDNAGTMTKTAGAASAHLNLPVNNSGSVSTTSGGIKLTQGGTHTGGFNTGSSSFIAFDGGTHQLTGAASMGGTGSYAVSNGIFDVDVPITLVPAISFQMIAGTLTGAANFTVQGPFLWTGGTMDNSSGGGQTILTGASQIASTTSTVILSARTLSNSGSFTYNPTPGIELSIDDAGLFDNTGIFNVVGDTEIDSNFVSTPTFNNGVGGVINKSTGAGSFDIYTSYTSSAGTLNLSSGIVTLYGGGQDLGNVTFGGAANKVVIDSSLFTLTGQPNLIGGGVIVVQGTATLGLSTSVTIDKLELLGGTIAGGTLNIATSLLWRQGKMQGGVTSIAGAATVDATSLTGTITLDTHSLTNGGTFTWDGTTFPLQLINGSSLINNNTFTATGSGFIGGAPPTNAITNNGTFEKTGGTSGTRIDPAFGNSGLLSSEVSGQSLIINGGGSQTGGGSMNANSGAFLDFFGGTYSVPPGTSPFMGPGIFRVNGGTLAITGSLNILTPATLMVESGVLDVATSATFQVAHLAWLGGTLQGNGTTRVNTSGVIGNVAPTNLAGNHTLTIPGTVNYDADSTNFLTIGGTANLNVENGGNLYLTTNGIIGGTSTDGVTVSGELTKTGAGVARIDVPLNTNSGTVVSFGATGGTLQINGGGGSSVTSTIETALSGFVQFSAGTFALGSGVTVSGTGTIAVTGATLNVNTPSLTIPNLDLTAGTLGGIGAVTVTNGTWTGGSMSGTGTTGIGTALTIGTGTPKTLGRNLTNNGTVTMNDGFTISGAAVIINGATSVWIDNAAASMTCAGCLFNNQGAYDRTGPLVTHSVPFNNDGTVTLAIGSTGLGLASGGTHNGDFATSTGTLVFGGVHTFNAGSDTTGSGFVSYTGTASHQGTVALTGNGTVDIPVGGFVVFNTTSPVSTPRILVAAHLGGAAAVNITGSAISTWQNGTITGSGAFSVGSSATFSIQGAGSQTLDGRTITNNGTLSLAASVANGGTPGSIVNLNGFRAQPTGNVVVGPSFTNQGVAQFGAFDVAFNGGYTQNSGSTELVGGTLSSPITVSINGGTITGTGTIGANVASNGTFSMGNSAGTVTVAGNFTQSSSGVINSEIGGTAPGTGYDQLIVTGTATLNGTMNVTLINAFTPADANVFDLVTWASNPGTTFSAVNLPAYPSGTLNPTYETGSFRITAVSIGDVSITKTGPATSAVGQTVSFSIAVNNAGPAAVDNVIVADPTPANMLFISNGGDCTTAFPCALGTIAASATRTIVSTYTITGGGGTNLTNTATVTTTTTESVTTNNSASATLFVDVSDLSVSKSGPATAGPGEELAFTITVVNGGLASADNVSLDDPTPPGLQFVSNSGDCNTAFPCALGNLPAGATRTILATYVVSAGAAGTDIANTASVTTTSTDDPANNTSTAVVGITCDSSTPTNLSPSGNAPASGTLSWLGTSDSYIVYLGPGDQGCSTQFATTSLPQASYSNLAGGTYQWRVESVGASCGTFSSSCVTFTVAKECTVPEAPIVSVVGQTTSAKTYEVTWPAVEGATRYEIDEATNPEFLGAVRLTVNGLSQAYKHDVTEATAFFYRVRAFTQCTTVPGPASTTVRVVIIPLPPKEQPNPSVNVPAGSDEVVVQTVFIPGQPGQSLFFTATTDRPWLTVRPEQGVLPPAGITLEVIADPATLPNGTFTASIIVTITDGTSGRIGTNGTSIVTSPFSINLVTPVTPVASKPSTSQYALIIPTAGHLDGINSHWQSDIRVTNAGFRSARYRLTFTPSGGQAQGVKQTNITVDAGATTALDDIVRNWFGLGTLNDGSNGMLEILPLDDPATTAQSTVASSRTYNVSGNGTLGQYIPAVPFPNFIGKALPNALPQVLSLQQIAQSQAYRTNVGLAEAGGASVEAVLTVFNSSGAKLKDIPVALAAGQQLQLNQLLATNGIELADGRIEAKVTGGDGKITAYASVVDSASQDPLLVSGTPLSGSGSTKFVLPGVANLDNSLAQWRTDMRVFNFGTVSQPATLTFFPFNNGPSKTAQVLLGAGQVMTLDNVLQSQFQTQNAGGVVHLTTSQPASLVVTGRTYNQTANGTFGQFVPAVTADQAVGSGGRTLHILQVEDSTRYRTNVGLAEVTGKAVTVEVQVVLPDSKITPTVQIPLAANEFRQFNVIRELGVGNVYNARITVRVVGGEGRVTAYGSVIDEVTQDPTYVPAQ